MRCVFLPVALGCLLATAAAGQDASRTGPATLESRLQQALDDLVGPDRYPGMTLGVALSDGSSLGLAAGLADTARAEAMRPDHLMLQGSVGKTYFGAVALQLVHEGRLDLDDRLAEHLGDVPWYHRLPNANDVTLRQLMRHQSGIVRYEMNPRFMADLTADPYRTWSPADRLSYLLDSEPPFPAGEGWDYSDTNYILLAMVVERVTGTAMYDEIRRRILAPLGFDHTLPSDRPEIPGLAQGYAGPGNGFGTFDATLVDGRLAFNPQFEWAGGGFASTARDLARWIKDIHEGRAFDASLLDEVRTGVPAPLGPRGQYGLGVIMLELPAGTAWGHSGFMPGYRTEAYYFPEHGFALALQVNSSNRDAFRQQPLQMLDRLAQVVKEDLAARHPKP